MAKDPQEAGPLERLLSDIAPTLERIGDHVQVIVNQFRTLGRQLNGVADKYRSALDSLPVLLPAVLHAKIEEDTPPGPLRDFTMTAFRLVLSDYEHDREVGHVILRWLHAGGGEPLETCLGLRRRGTGGSPPRALALHRRDRILKQICSKYWSGSTTDEAAREMIASYERYQTRQWPRDCDAERAPPDGPEHVWWHLLRDEFPLPAKKRLRQILDRQD